DITYGEPESRFMEDSDAYMTEEDSAIESDENQSGDIESHNLSDIQRDIVLKALELLDEDIKYGYNVNKILVVDVLSKLFFSDSLFHL
ncbi:unnamed protein product, partial [marine sediment metagenome]